MFCVSSRLAHLYFHPPVWRLLCPVRVGCACAAALWRHQAVARTRGEHGVLASWH